MPIPNPKGPTPDQALLTFRIIGISLAMGVTMFALVSWFVHLDAGGPAGTGDPALMFNIMLLTVVATSGVAIIWWRNRVAPLIDGPPGDDWLRRAGEIQTNVIIVWALVEGGALFAEVVYFLYGMVVAGVLGVALIWGAVAFTWPRREWVAAPR